MERRHSDLPSGIRMSYLFRQGNENLPAVIIIHGHLMTSDDISELADNIDCPNQVFVPDLRCSWRNVTAQYANAVDEGKTEDIDWEIKTGHSVQQYALDIVELIKLHNLKKPVIIGGSLGSAVTIAISKLISDNISGICLLCPVMDVVHDFPSWLSGIGARLMARLFSPTKAALYVSKSVFPNWPERIKWFFETTVRHKKGLIIKSSDAILDFNARKYLGLAKDQTWQNPPFKVCVVYGTRDSLVFPYQVEVCKSMFSLEEGKNLFGFPETHNLPYRRPEEMKKILEAFIADCKD